MIAGFLDLLGYEGKVGKSQHPRARSRRLRIWPTRSTKRRWGAKVDVPSISLLLIHTGHVLGHRA